MKILFSLLLLFALLPGMLHAAETTEELTPAKQHAILYLMELTGSEKIALALGAHLTQQMYGILEESGQHDAPVKVYEIINEEVKGLLTDKMPDLIGQLVPIYHRHFTHEEIQGLIAFYRTDLGQKTLHELPRVIEESGELGAQWGQVLGMELVQRIDKRLAAEGISLEDPKNETHP